MDRLILSTYSLGLLEIVCYSVHQEQSQEEMAIWKHLVVSVRKNTSILKTQTEPLWKHCRESHMKADSPGQKWQPIWRFLCKLTIVRGGSVVLRGLGTTSRESSTLVSLKVGSWPRSVSLRRVALLLISKNLNKLSKGTAGFSPFNEF